MVANQMKVQSEEAKKNKKVKTYSIKELLEGNSSDDESYKDDVKNMNQFKWFQNGYKHIYDQLDYTEQGKTSVMRDQYPSSEVSDKKIILKPKDKDETQPPEKILVVATNGGSVDQLL